MSIELITIDNNTITIPRDIILTSSYIKNLLDDMDDDDIPKVELDHAFGNYEIMKKIIEFYEYHFNNGKPKEIPKPIEKDSNGKVIKSITLDGFKEYVCEFDNNFFENIDIISLFKMILLTNYLGLDDLSDLIGAKIALDHIKNKNIDELRNLFCNEIKNGLLDECNKDYIMNNQDYINYIHSQAQILEDNMSEEDKKKIAEENAWTQED